MSITSQLKRRDHRDRPVVDAPARDARRLPLLSMGVGLALVKWTLLPEADRLPLYGE